MKMQLKDRGTIPYGGGFTVTDPLTGNEHYGTTFKMLVDSIRASRRANSVPMGIEFESEIEQWACEKYPAECESFNPKRPRKRSLTLGDVITGTRVMLQHWWNGRKLVPREEAERRAQICLNCPKNQTFPKPCVGICGELHAIVADIIDAQGTQYDSRLHSCDICGCFLQSAIWVPQEIQWNALPEEQKEMFTTVENCWKIPRP